MLSGTLGTSLLRILIGKGVMTAREGTIRVGQDFNVASSFK